MHYDKPHHSSANEGIGLLLTESCLNLQHNVNIDTGINNAFIPASEYDGLPYEVIEDEDEEEQVTDIFHLPYYLPKRLSTLGSSTEGDETDFSEAQIEVTIDDEVDLPYGIVSDESDSKVTLRPTKAPPEWLSQLEDEDILVSPNIGPTMYLAKLPGKACFPEITGEGLSETETLTPSAAVLHSSDDGNDIANADVTSSKEVPIITVHSVSTDSSSDAITSGSPAPKPYDSVPSAKDRPSRKGGRSHELKATTPLTAGNLTQLEGVQSKKSGKSTELKPSGHWKNAKGFLR
ncbi:MAG: hypothetical protein FRX48_07187 [Lasallia pustulata]|uniref:Uncharacterized protein n=1 Tax=Lasallia pustulata TaxID=136370 RepID=A0A5M8PIH3_9LECA|nr:MAG: hypothetical protein FRX48_07187 [Lasallia pustulata]